MTNDEVAALLDVCEAADDQDTGSLDDFREAATVGLVAELARFFLTGVWSSVSRPQGLTG